MRNPFRLHCYDSREVCEMQAVHKIYRLHLKPPFFPKLENTPLALTANTTDLPQHTLSQSDLHYLVPTHEPSELFNWGKGAVQLIVHFIRHRQSRWWHRGYDNDPISLICMTLRSEFARVAYAPCNDTTYTQLKQLRAWIVALGRKSGDTLLFNNEPQTGPHSFWHLLEQLLSTLDSVEVTTQRRLSLAASRERFKCLYNQETTLLDTLTNYLFYACSNTTKKHSGVFSLASVHCTYDESLKKQLDTREGALLRSVIFNPSMKTLFNQTRPSPLGGVFPLLKGQEHALDLSLKQPMYLSKEELDMTLALASDKPSCLTPDFLTRYNITPQNRSLTFKQSRKRLEPSFYKRTVTLCSDLTTESLEPFVRLHSLVQCFTEYCHKTDLLWIAAGLGGDELICYEASREVQEFLDKVTEVIHTISQALTQLNEANRLCYIQSVNKSRHPVWQKNHRVARDLQETAQKQIKACELSLNRVKQSIDEPSLYHKDKGWNVMSSQRKRSVSNQVVEHKEDNRFSHQLTLAKPKDLDITLIIKAISSQAYSNDLQKSQMFSQQFITLFSVQPRWYEWTEKVKYHFTQSVHRILHNAYLRKEIKPDALPSKKVLQKIKKEVEKMKARLWWFQFGAKEFLEGWITTLDQACHTIDSQQNLKRAEQQIDNQDKREKEPHPISDPIQSNCFRSISLVDPKFRELLRQNKELIETAKIADQLRQLRNAKNTKNDVTPSSSD